MRVDPTYVSGLVSSLNQMTALEAKITSATSSGVRLTSLGDDPVAASQSIHLSNAITEDDSFVSRASTIMSKAQASDTALASVVSNLTSAISLGVQGQNGTLSGDNLKTLAGQLKGIRDTVLSLANSSYQGSYLFAGSKSDTQPYVLDSTVSPATLVYSGDDISQTTTTAAGQKLQIGLPGSQLFSDGGTGNVFTALNAMIDDFSSGTASSTSATDLATLRSALSTVTVQRAVLNSGMSRLQSASSAARDDETNLKAAQSSLLSADPAGLATQLSSVKTQQSALLNTIAIVQKGSLFDYM